MIYSDNETNARKGRSANSGAQESPSQPAAFRSSEPWVAAGGEWFLGKGASATKVGVVGRGSSACVDWCKLVRAMREIWVEWPLSALLLRAALCGALQACVLSAPIEIDTGRADTGRADTGRADTGYDGETPLGMVFVPAGTFTRGSPNGEGSRNDDETQHSVTIERSFFIHATEVTQGEWKTLSDGTNPSAFSSCGDVCPVVQVDWYSTAAFAIAKSAAAALPACYSLSGCTDASNGWKDGIHSGCTGSTNVGPTCMGYRLPTEAEWEYAARAGTTGATYGDLNAIAWYNANSGGTTHAVGQKQPNAWGLYDMLGNVFEWNSDWYGNYPSGLFIINPTGAFAGSARVVRGGSWNDSRSVRAAHRGSASPSSRGQGLGFRLVRTAP